MISSFNIKEPDSSLILSNSYRIAFTSVLKSLTKEFAKNNVSVINIAPGPFDTDRIRSLVSNIKEFEKTIPMGRLGDVREIGNFVSSIVDKEIKFLTGVTINFDGGKSNYLL
jgi:3-oxoacyl-[acyl-carrier protein] reductase